MKKILYFIVLFVTVLSCTMLDNKTIFHIENDSDLFITDVEISNGYNKVYIDSLKKTKIENLELKFENVPKIDGGYKISFKKESNDVFYNFGYFSNGIPLSVEYDILVKNDTILISEITN